jgi:hypothetical protein
MSRRGDQSAPRFRHDCVIATLAAFQEPGMAHDPATLEEGMMTRSVGDRYRCESCGAQLVYEKACPCAEGMAHQEVCCGKQMKQVGEGASSGGGGR